MTDHNVEIERQEESGHGRYELRVDGDAIGELTYSRPAPDHVLATHTFIDPRRRQSGLARQLVDRLAEDARAEGAKVSPVCPYIRWVFEKNEEEFGEVWER